MNSKKVLLVIGATTCIGLAIFCLNFKVVSLDQAPKDQSINVLIVQLGTSKEEMEQTETAFHVAGAMWGLFGNFLGTVALKRNQ